VYLANEAGALAGPMLAGSIRSATGSYPGVFPWVAALAVSGMVIAYWLMRPPSVTCRFRSGRDLFRPAGTLVWMVAGMLLPGNRGR
jgi:hypothetical protein